MTGGSITLTSGNATGLYSAAVGGGLTLTAEVLELVDQWGFYIIN